MPVPLFDREAALAIVNGNAGLHRRLLALFLQTQGATPDLIDAAVRDRRGQDAERLAHTLKSAAAGVGAGALSRRAAALEARLRNGEFSGIDADSAGLRAVHAATLRAISEATEDRPGDLRVVADAPRHGQAGDGLRRLVRMLEDGDGAAPELLSTLRPALADRLAPAAVELLSSHVGAFDYASALALLGATTATSGGEDDA